MASHNKWAIIIGIDVYFRRSGGSRSFLDLHGCVSDAENTYEYLRGSPFNIPADNMILLTSSHKDFPNMSMSPHQDSIINMSRFPHQDSKLALKLATYENIINSLKQVLESSQPGDHVYFHYSGHGARFETHPKFHDWPGKNYHLDEALIPADIDVAKGDYRGLPIRDWELAYVFGAMVERGLKLTVVIDSCSSGGSTRGPVPMDASVDITEGDPINMTRIRGMKDKVTGIKSQEKDSHTLFPMSDIKTAWWKLQAQITVRKAWLLQPFQYNIITACLAHESSHEVLGQGVLSKAVIDSLKEIHELGKLVTYQMVFRNVYDRCYGRTYDGDKPRDVQTPVMLGDPDKIFFGPDETTLEHIASIPVHALPRLQWIQRTWGKEPDLTDRENPKLILRAGKAHGVREGEIYGIYEWTASAEDMRDPSRAIGQLVVLKVKEVVSVLGLIIGKDNARLLSYPWKTGRQAILLHGPANAIQRVRLFGSTTFPELQSGSAEQYFNGPVPLAFSANPATTDYQIAEEDGKFWLGDADGKRIPNVPGCNQLASMLKYLTHVCQYKMRRETEHREPSDYNITINPAGINVEGKNEITLKFENTDYDAFVNFVVYHFTPNWGIRKIYPQDADFESIDKGDTRTFSLQRDPIKEEIPKDMDFVKVLIMNGSTTFSTWELPDIPLDGNMVAESRHADTMLQLLSSSKHQNVEAESSEHLYDDFDVTEEEVSDETEEGRAHNLEKLYKCWGMRFDISASKQ